MTRTFQHRVTLSSIVCVVLLAFLTLYFFWHRGSVSVIIGVVLLVITTLVIERLIHTSYTFNDAGMLEINRGRFSSQILVPISDIISAETRKQPFGVTRYVLIEFGASHFISVQPDNEEAFIQEIRKRQDGVREGVDE